MSDPLEPVVLVTYDSRHEAELALGILENAEIAAAIHADDGGRMEPGLAFQGRVRLLVAGDEVDAARELLSDADLLHDIVPPTWSAHLPIPASSRGPARDLVAMALLFGGVILLFVDLIFEISDSHALAIVGAVGLAIGIVMTITAGRSTPAREASRRRD